MSSQIAALHQLHGVQPVLKVADVAAAARYFVDVLGFELDFLTGEPVSHGRVRTGDGSYGQPIYIHLSRLGGDEAGRTPSGELRLHVGHDVDGLCETYRARGANVVQEPVSQPWGLREFVVLEANGHRLRFCGEA